MDCSPHLVLALCYHYTMKNYSLRSILLFIGLILFSLPACAQNSPQPQPDPTGTLPPIVLPPTPTPIQNATVPAPATKRPGRLSAIHRSGQTFLTWPERADLTGERYRVYRSSEPITAGSLAQASLLAQVGEDSARVWANYFIAGGKWIPRLTERFIIKGGAAPLTAGIGALVWTLASEDFGGQNSGTGYYAVTVTPSGEREAFMPDLAIGPVKEAVGDPEPVEITHSPGIKPGPGAHFYLQYIDLRRINPTFHVPNTTNRYYGFDPASPSLTDALAYTYDYAVFEPWPELCGGQVPDTLPVMIFLHGARDNRYPTPQDYIYPYCAYGMYPVDQTETWYFGFARSHDYRTDAPFAENDVIENYTEQRILRMLYDLMRKPPGPAVDTQRVYLFGHSMGGTGALAFAQRYPNVFAAIYSGQPVTHFRRVEGNQKSWNPNVVRKWGSQDMNLPVAISAPNHWADHLQKYNGVGVYDWEDFGAAFDLNASPNRTGDEMAPFGIDHGTLDDSVQFPTQGRFIYPLLNASPRAWAGAVTETEHHWSVFGYPLPNLGMVEEVPFWGLSVIRDETVPGFSNLSSNLAEIPGGPTTYNQSLMWSSSWNAWDGPPVDRPDVWQMSLCTVAVGSDTCGSGGVQTVDITPRRLQQFTISSGSQYDWVIYAVSDRSSPDLVLASGTVTADANGLVTIPQVRVLPGGIRLEVRPQP